MPILFIVALVLAWPTFGLSLLCWVVCYFLFGRKTTKANIPEKDLASIEAVFRQEYAVFFKTLDVPYLQGHTITHVEAERCGRHIKNYIAGNPSEARLFFEGLAKWGTKGGEVYSSPVTAAGEELKYNVKENVHGVSYRAIEALMTNNPGLGCFKSVNLPMISQYVDAMEIGAAPAQAIRTSFIFRDEPVDAAAHFTSAENIYDADDLRHDSNFNAILLYRKAAELGHLEAQFRLGSIYLDKSDLKNALKWLLNAAEKGHVGAHCRLGNLFSRKRDAESLIWYCKAAELGSVDAMISLGHLYEVGHVVPKDLSKAAAWRLRAAELGDVETQLRLARMYNKGAGVEQDKLKADFWLDLVFSTYLRLAKEGSAEAQYMLGCLYMDGEGVPENPVEAEYWIKKAALQDHFNAKEAVMMYGFDDL